MFTTELVFWSLGLIERLYSEIIMILENEEKKKLQ